MVTRFEELIAWQKARAWTNAIYRSTAAGAFQRDFGLRDQIRRAAVSVMANLAEGFKRGHRAEFRQFVQIAKASAPRCDRTYTSPSMRVTWKTMSSDNYYSKAKNWAESSAAFASH